MEKWDDGKTQILKIAEIMFPFSFLSFFPYSHLIIRWLHS